MVLFETVLTLLYIKGIQSCTCTNRLCRQKSGSRTFYSHARNTKGTKDKAMSADTLIYIHKNRNIHRNLCIAVSLERGCNHRRDHYKREFEYNGLHIPLCQREDLGIL